MSDEPIDAYDAVMRLEDDLVEAIDALVAWWRAHENQTPHVLSGLIEKEPGA